MEKIKINRCHHSIIYLFTSFKMSPLNQKVVEKIVTFLHCIFFLRNIHNLYQQLTYEVGNKKPYWSSVIKEPSINDT